MLKHWWERWPGRLEAELQALDRAQIAYRQDDEAFRQGFVKLHLEQVIAGERINLTAIFPDFYPKHRFEVFAENLDLKHHQNPFEKNLCLIGRSALNWNTTDLLADYLEQRLPVVLKAAVSDDLKAISALEERQGEPFSGYYPCLPESMIIVDSSWEIPLTESFGELQISFIANRIISRPSRSSFLSSMRGAVENIFGGNGAILCHTKESTFKLFSHKLTGRWIRMTTGIRECDPSQFFKQVVMARQDLAHPRWTKLNGLRYDLIGVLFPEEVRWRETGNGWVFLLRVEKGNGSKRQKGTALVRAGRAGQNDLHSRIPELSPLIEKHVAIIGLGGLGAPSTIELARAGVGTLKILDIDFVDPGTVVRWPFGFTAAGHSKVDFIQNFIDQNYPYTNVESWLHRLGAVRQENSSSDLEVLSKILSDTDLVLDASTDLNVHDLLAELSKEIGIPYVYLFSTHGGWGGLVAQIRPNRRTAGCWLCLQYALDDGTIPEPLGNSKGFIRPTGCSDPTFTGTAFDISEVALEGVRTVIGELCVGSGSGYPQASWDVALLSLRDENGQRTPPRWETYNLARHPSCPNTH